MKMCHAVLTVLLAAGLGDGSGSCLLRVAEWGLVREFEEAFESHAASQGIAVDVQFMDPPFSEHEDIYHRLRGREADILLVPSETLKSDNGRVINLLMPIEEERIPHFGDIEPALRNRPIFRVLDCQNAARFGVPYRADVTGLLYRVTHFDTPPSSFEVLWKPELKGRVLLFGVQPELNVRPVLATAGHPCEVFYRCEAEDIDWDAAQRRLNALVRNAGGVFAGPSGLANTELDPYVLVYGAGSLLPALNNGGGEWRLTRQPEHTELWLGDLCLARRLADDAARLEAAYLFIGFLLSPEMQRAAYERHGYVPVHGPVRNELEAAATEDPRFEEDFFAEAEHVARPQNTRTKNFYKLLWRRAVAATGDAAP